MTILITGSAGFIGYHVTKKILNKNIKVIGIDNINKHLASIYNHQNNIIFSTLAAKIFNSTDESISIINKKRDFENKSTIKHINCDICTFKLA